MNGFREARERRISEVFWDSPLPWRECPLASPSSPAIRLHSGSWTEVEDFFWPTWLALPSPRLKKHETEMRLPPISIPALVTREIIGEAKGILMERERITSAQAFDILRRASQHLNLKLRDIAQSRA